MHQTGKLAFFGALAGLADPGAFASHLAPLRKADWVVYAKPSFGGPEAVLAYYLSRYTHRVAISNHRLVSADADTVAFRWKDYRIKRGDRMKTMRLPTDEFIRRFLIHVLPSGFHRIRHLIENLAHGARGIRTHLFPPHGLALPLLELDATAFVPQMGKNFEIGHLGNDQGICLLLASDTLTSRKGEMLEHWHAIAANESDRETLGKACDGLYIANHAILHEYLLIVLHLTEVAFAAQRETLPLFSITSAQMLSRAKALPLMQSSLCL